MLQPRFLHMISVEIESLVRCEERAQCSNSFTTHEPQFAYMQQYNERKVTQENKFQNNLFMVDINNI